MGDLCIANFLSNVIVDGVFVDIFKSNFAVLGQEAFGSGGCHDAEDVIPSSFLTEQTYHKWIEGMLVVMTPFQ